MVICSAQPQGGRVTPNRPNANRLTPGPAAIRLR